MTFTQPQLPKVRYRTRVIFALYLVAEIAAFVAVAMAVDVLAAIVITIATTFLGSVLLRVLGTKALRQYRAALLAEKSPESAVVTGAIGVIGSVLLMLPGFISDFVGVLFVLPPTRRLLRPLFTKLLAARTETMLRANWFNRRPSDPGHADDDVIDGEVIDDESGRRPDPPHETGPKSLP